MYSFTFSFSFISAKSGYESKHIYHLRKLQMHLEYYVLIPLGLLFFLQPAH